MANFAGVRKRRMESQVELAGMALVPHLPIPAVSQASQESTQGSWLEQTLTRLRLAGMPYTVLPCLSLSNDLAHHAGLAVSPVGLDGNQRFTCLRSQLAR